MERLLDSIVRSLREGASTAVGKAEDFARLGHARLEIAAAKNRITQMQAALGATVYGQFVSGSLDARGGDEVAQLCGEIKDLEEELADLEERYGSLREDLRSAGPAVGDDDVGTDDVGTDDGSGSNPEGSETA